MAALERLAAFGIVITRERPRLPRCHEIEEEEAP
jgi:hypothetical protein